MIKLKFIPPYFPVLLLPIYWIYFLCFYIVYIPFHLICWIFSPWRSDKKTYQLYLEKTSKTERDLSVEEEEKQDESA